MGFNSGFSPSRANIKSSTVIGGTASDTHQVTGSMYVVGNMVVTGSIWATGGVSETSGTFDYVSGSKGEFGTLTVNDTAITGLPAGSNTQVQYNNAGAFAGSANLTFDGTDLTVSDNEDAKANIGRALVGYDGTNSDYATFAHRDKATSANFALQQRNDGTTLLNTPSGGTIFLRTGGNSNALVVAGASNSNIGINTGTPLARLHVSASSVESDVLRIDGVGTNTNSLYVSGSGRVGINTGTPSNPLSVTPTQYETGTASQTGTTVTGVGTTWTTTVVGSVFLYADGTSSGAITARASNTSITVTTSQTVGSQGYKIKPVGLQVTTDGLVGINQGTPTYSAHITAPANGKAFVVEAADGGDWFGINAGTINFNTAGGFTNAGGIGLGQRFNIAPINATYGALGIGKFAGSTQNIVEVNSANSDEGGDFFVIDSDGKVGINTSTPSNPLSVTPTQYDTGTASQTLLTVTGVGTTWTTAMIGSVFVYADGTSSGAITARASNTSITVTTSQTVGSQGYKIKPVGLQVATDGKVGLGTSSPTHTLHIANGGPSALYLQADTDNDNEDDTAYVKMTQDGGATDAILGLCPNDASKDPAGVTYTGAVGSSFLWGTHTSTPIQIGTYANVRMTIKQAGNVGIGITNPTELLDVAGTANATALSVGGAAITSTPAELNLLDASTVTAPSEGIWTGVERVAVINIGASEYTAAAHVLGVTLPDKAILTKATLDVFQGLVGGTTTISLTTTGNVHGPVPAPIDFLAGFGGGAIPIAGFAVEQGVPLSLQGGKLNGASTLTFTVAGDPLTAGGINVYVHYIMGT